MPQRLLPWLALCACASLHATPQITESRLQALASQPYWLALGHYTPGKLGGWRSYVDDPKFFLAADGGENPEAELKATLKALYAPASLGDKQAQCVFPARTRWLKQQLRLSDLPQPQCKEFATWYSDINPHSTVLVFPAAYLNSPSSMFGHTLLRIDQADVDSNNTALLSYALNFGAYIEGMDNSILYAWKGLMGGYPGLFALVPYREKLSEYSRLENRDLWEYRLNLTAEETGRMIEHVWELKQVRFKYYFFDENCSFRLLELLEIARPGTRLTEHFPLTAIPTDTVRAVKNAGMIERIDYRPSREKELLARAEPLNRAEKRLARRLADDDKLLDGSEFKALPADRQALVQDTAFRLLRYRATGKERDELDAARSYQLLRAINRNPPPPLPVERPGQPEEGHQSRTWQLGAGSRDGRAFADYGLRMAYHDLEDNLYGFPLGAQIELGQLKLRQYEGNRWQLQRLDLVTIRSLTPRNELLQPLSWQVSSGWERVLGKHSDEHHDSLVAHLNGGAGGSWKVSDDLQAYALGTARIENNPDFAATIAPALGFDGGLLWRNGLGNLSLEAKGDYFHNGEVRRNLSLGQQFELSRNLGLRLSADREYSHLAGPINEVMLELRWYHY
ncbi:Lnb N-terminal periplasmic domain-containing protein [Pseudomonas panipatensis]|uniref:Lnb N-terminal periplasmic domain-containing protein n=1 Tax=Pseudomonas panipatensis TaxID=428992 RepID=UPI0035AF5A25